MTRDVSADGWAVLQKHDLEAAIADAVLRLAAALRERSSRGFRRERREFAAMVDARTGEQVGPICSGAPDEVDATLLLAAAKGREVVSIHTHLGSSAFSPRDAQVFLSEPAIRVLVVIGVDRTLYVLSAVPATGKDPALAFTIEAHYERVVLAVAGTYRALRRQGYLTKAQAWREQTHDTWVQISRDLGLRYDRVTSVETDSSP